MSPDAINHRRWSRAASSGEFGSKLSGAYFFAK
jgi:hypothetical protein